MTVLADSKRVAVKWPMAMHRIPVTESEGDR